ncbi:MAG: ferredoxin [Patescibacteria group bacterium]|nr:ferredoxin [Patescibacteria group bacterium]MBU1160368.1 ferredoxin [Patescibacteria group bacterium]MBU1421371.1 ferredoxin [Patescibacteria group bacterium]MBU1684473.1 ferredoxin [Patescibacteria group bacterium]MBU1778527.1 ferredoxin [Patescibacteria group bacterium]
MIVIKKNLCIGCGACVLLCPEIFQINSDGKSEVISQKNQKCAKQAAQSCPVQAITWNA